MTPTQTLPLPAASALRKLGRDLALARRKRGISTADMAARLFVSRDTLWRLERGDRTVAIGHARDRRLCPATARPAGGSGRAGQRRRCSRAG